MNVYAGNELRKGQRAVFPFEIYYKEFNKSDQGFKHGHGKDISSTGMFFESYENFLPCTILEVKIEIPSDFSERKSITALVEVVRNEEVKRQWLYNTGVSFCRISPEQKAVIEEYVSKNAGSFLEISR